ncbi:ankyrin repeat-containing domain protein [Pelagophyceae sp. CCMP2097]|nr:ankyrin repeat-containing domain protein [Pelagophyceae sp. CCMP2097]
MYGEASRRVREQRRKVGDVKSVPSELKLEAVPRRRFEARFDDVQLTLDLVPGAGDVGLVVVGWHAPVLDHDSAANDVEAQMARVDELRKAYVATARTASNWDTAWLLMNERPEELEEYLKLRPRMADFRERVALMRKTDEKVLAEQQWKRYHALRGKCERLLSARERFLAFKAVKDAAFATMKDADRILEKLFEHERSSAECISVDHTDADAAGVAVAELFPAIKVNMIVSKVAGVPTELLLSEEVSSLIDDAPRPHALEFRRYDYRRHSTTLKWEPLQVLRERGVFVDDPRVDRDMFVRACRAGDVEAVEDALARGSEVDAADSNGCTGLHLAAANDCVAVVDVLLKAGAHVDFRDHNRETPLFGAARRGSVNAAKRLMAKGAKTVGQIDRAGRSLLVHAVLSNSMPMLRLFLEVLPQDVDRWLPEKLWHWTPLHYAAAAGQAAVVAELLGAGASAHAASRAGESPLQLAAKSPVSAAAAKILADHIRAEPATPRAQCVLAGGRDRGAVWLGARQAAYPKFATDRGFQSILSIYVGPAPP